MTEHNDNSRDDSSQEQTRTPDQPPSSREEYSPRGPEPATGSTAQSKTSSRQQPFSRSDWETLPSDPDLADDLGYRITGWESIETVTDSTQVIYMPEDEDLLRDDAFIVAEEDIICDLGTQY